MLAILAPAFKPNSKMPVLSTAKRFNEKKNEIPIIDIDNLFIIITPDNINYI
jgi:hypothetical protein